MGVRHYTADVLYWYSYTQHKNVFNGELSPRATEPGLLFAALISAANPVIYTIASRKYFRYLCQCLLCRPECCKQRTAQLIEPLIPYDDRDTTRCSACCSKLFGRRKSGFGGEVRYVSTETNETEESSVFPETDDQIHVDITAQVMGITTN